MTDRIVEMMGMADHRYSDNIHSVEWYLGWFCGNLGDAQDEDEECKGDLEDQHLVLPCWLKETALEEAHDEG